MKQFYYKRLHLKDPWYVDRIEVNDELNRVDIYVKHHNPIRVACPVCGEFYSMYDHSPEREFQHLDTCEMHTFVHVRLPRVKCPIHGIKQIVSELGDVGCHMTFAYERRILALAMECSISAITRLEGLGWDQVFGCMERGVARGFKRKTHRIPEIISVDEKSFAKGHKYETLIVDNQKGTVEYVTDENSQESLESYYRQFTEKERKSVRAVTMDMWDPFIAATRNYIPGWNRKIVFDRFHVMQHAGKAVDTVRKEENKALLAQGNGMLKGTKYLWLWNQRNIPHWRRPEFHQLKNTDLGVSRAWAIKENLRHLWDYRSETWARKFFKRWFFWATHSRLEPVKMAAKTIKSHFENIVTYVVHRYTNAVVEGINSKIEKVKRLACGYRNRDHYKTAIYFHCGGLSIFPVPPDTCQIRWA